MTTKKTLLEEGTVRQFMKLANIAPLSMDFVEKLYETGAGDTGASAGDESATDKGEEDYTTKKGKKKKTSSPGRGEKKGDEAFVNEEESMEMVEVDLGEQDELEVGAEEEIEGPGGEEEIEMGAEEEVGEDAEVSVTPEEAAALVSVADKLSAALGGGEEEMEMGAEEEIEEPLPGGGEEEIELGAEEEVMQESGDEDADARVDELVATIAENVTKRVHALASKQPKKQKRSRA